ncbi:hypothetical protein PV327_008737 [Microctonus hyperodae]|uniref:Peptidase M14 domain-containing protein n=1 Tax=Microctonus hyperodae TaxID=165561 RepID=A0AA39FTE0_MICHY|nr:hypothetical protein PV327_008737 [Microctonus hyperodae]
MQQISIQCSVQEQLSFIQLFINNPKMDFLKLTRRLNESIEVFVEEDQLMIFKNALNQKNISYTVIIEDLEATFDEEMRLNQAARLKSAVLNQTDVPFDYYPRYEEIEQYLKNLAINYKDIVTLEHIGYSFEGRSLYVVKISRGGEGKFKILIDAGIHAREWISPSTALYTIHQLVVNKSNEQLYENVDWYIIPSINPDGYEYSHTSYRLWRKTRSVDIKTECRGVDANRNFELEWMTVGASNDPCSEIYAGPNAFSENETQALRDFVLANSNTIKVYLTLHSYGQYLLHPWGYTSDLPENEPMLRNVGEAAAGAIAAKFGTKYVVGSSTNILYAAAGGSDDWMMGVAGADLSYTIELPGGRFDPPPSRIASVGIETFEGFKIFQQFVEKKYVK